MAKTATPTALSFETLPQARAKTEAAATFLEQKLQTYVEALRLLMAPQRALGRFVGGKDAVGHAERAYNQLCEQFRTVCPSYGLTANSPDEELGNVDTVTVCYPWEYSHVVKNDKESKSLILTSPVRWILTYKSAYSLHQFRQAVSGSGERVTRDVRQFVVNALAMVQLLKAFPKLTEVLADLHFGVVYEPLPGLGPLAFATIQACVTSQRPSDELLLMAMRFSGVPAFIELIDLDSIRTLEDPLKSKFEALVRES
jgi:hypothetical protein